MTNDQVSEEKAGETRYLLSDGLGSVRHAVDDNGLVVVYNEFDPYGNPIANRQSQIVNRPLNSPTPYLLIFTLT